MKKNSTLYLTRAAMIAALYVALTYLSSVFGLSSGAIQLRISEALTILPIFFPEAVIGLTVGCLLSNILVGSVLWDVVFGTLATLIGALGARFLRNLPHKLKWLATVPTILSNAVIVPFVLIYAYMLEGAYFYFLFTVFVGEFISAGIFGSLLYYFIKKRGFSHFGINRDNDQENR